VPVIGVQHNALGGKDRHFDHAHGVGKCEGMTGVVRSNNPGGRWPVVVGDGPSPVKVRELRRALWAAAKQSEGRCFHALYEQKRIVRYYLQRWPSQRAMSRLRDKVRVRTGRNRVGRDIREVITELDPVLRGWGNYFRTGNAAIRFRQVDDYVVWRLRRLMIKKRGRNLRAGQAEVWTEEWFNGHGLHRLRGTVRYSKAA
jgi:RNA-directed DNA polymerase